MASEDETIEAIGDLRELLEEEDLLLLFGTLTAALYVFLAFTPVTYVTLLVAILLLTTSFLFVAGAISVSRTLDAMKAGAEVIAQGALEADGIANPSSVFDRVRPGRGVHGCSGVQRAS